jgi:hypothetical protein
LTYCAYEQEEFPESDFERDANGVLWHKVNPRHTALGEIDDPEDIPGMEDADAAAGD